MIGLTDVSPSNRTPAALDDTDYTLCAHYPGTVPAGQTVDIECSTFTPRGRYVFLLRRGRNLYLALCELEVYAWATGKFRWHILITCSSSFQDDRGIRPVRDGDIHRVCWSLSLYVTMHRLLVACQVVVNAFYLSIYCWFQRFNMCFRFQLPASLRRADVVQRNTFPPTGFLYFFHFVSYKYSLSVFLFMYNSECNFKCLFPLHIAFVIRELLLMSGDLVVMIWPDVVRFSFMYPVHTFNAHWHVRVHMFYKHKYVTVLMIFISFALFRVH